MDLDRLATMGATLFSREVLGSVVDVTCVKRGRGGVLQLLAERFARSTCNKTQRIVLICFYKRIR